MTLTAELIGKKYFKGKVEVTDPCYDKDVWCRMTTDDVKAGNYNCIIWRGNSRIGIIGIYLDGKIPSQKTMEKIGTIGVDAGLAGFFMNKPDYSDKEWCEFCDSIKRGDAWIKGEGFFSCSGDGDGSYDVYAYKEDSNITALEIRFYKDLF